MLSSDGSFTLHLRASQWYETQGLLPDAIHHALEMNEWQRASELVLRVSEMMMKRGEVVTLADWFSQFPEDVIRSDPKLCLEYVWTLIITGQNEAAEELLEHVEKITADKPEYHGSMYTALAFLARTHGDIPATIALSERALELVPENDKSIRGILMVNLGIAYWHTGQMEKATQALLDSQLTAQETGNVYALLAALVFLARVQAVQGNLKQAARIFNQAIEKGKKAPIIGLAHLDLGALYYEWNDLKACREHLLEGRAINESSGNVEFKIAGYMYLARLEMADGHIDAAVDSLLEIQEFESKGEIPSPIRNRSIALQVELALMQDELPGAQQLAAQLDEDVDSHPFYRFLGLTEERLLIADGKKLCAARQLRTKRESADQAGWVYGGIAIRILESIAAEDEGTGLQLLSDALEQAQREGYLRAFADHGPVLVPSLMEAAQRGVYPEYIGKILAVIHQVSKQVAAAEEAEKLSEREIEVLRLVAAGLSNREIADKLYLSPGTIKTHVHNICGKLGASNRTQAVGQARDLNLI